MNSIRRLFSPQARLPFLRRSIFTEPSSPSTQGSPSPRLSAFTGKPDFYEALFFLDDILLQLQPLKKSLTTTAGQSVQWHERQALSDALGFNLSTLQHRKVKDKLAMLACYCNLDEIRQFLSNFTTDPVIVAARENNNAASSGVSLEKQEKSVNSIYGRIDNLGRAVAKGKRKSATAKAYLVDGEGLVYVNGKPAAEYFSRISDMFKLAEPFRVTSSFGRYNVWALVRGGGFTGQSGAVALAMAKSLAVKQPENIQILAPWGLLNQDNRQVERKKPGQPKARKKFTWVKR